MKRKFFISFALCLALTGCGSSNSVQQTETVPTTIETTVATTEKTTTRTTAETTTAEPNIKPKAKIETGITDLYRTIFLEFAPKFGKITFSEMETFVKSSGYKMFSVQPTRDDLGQIKITGNDNDSIWIMTYPNEAGAETLSAISYTYNEGKFEISITDEVHTSKIKYSTFHKNVAKNNVDSLDDCEIFMFGETSGVSTELNGDTEKLKLLYGDVVYIYHNGGTLVVKAKITPSINNKETINQNYFNIEDLVKNQGCDKYDTIDYWAVADMTDGSESKAIAFVVPKSTIDGIKNETIAANQLGDYVTDLYILPSLKE